MVVTTCNQFKPVLILLIDWISKWFWKVSTSNFLILKNKLSMWMEVRTVSDISSPQKRCIDWNGSYAWKGRVWRLINLKEKGRLPKENWIDIQVSLFYCFHSFKHLYPVNGKFKAGPYLRPWYRWALWGISHDILHVKIMFIVSLLIRNWGGKSPHFRFGVTARFQWCQEASVAGEEAERGNIYTILSRCL